MRRLVILPLLALALASGAQASTLVLPFQTVGVDDETATVAAGLLREDLQALGVVVAPIPADFLVPAGADEAAAAAAAAQTAGADRVVYGSLSRLGEKIICRMHATRVGEAAPFFNDQVNAMTVEDLDIVMKRIAEAIALERATVGNPTIDTVTQEEARRPRTVASRRGFGMRAGFMKPVGDSYGGVDRLASIRIAYKYETPDYLVETTTLTGLAWGGDGGGDGYEEEPGADAIDWTILDLFGARVYGVKDRATYIGGGLGIHSIKLERTVNCHTETGPDWEYVDCDYEEDSMTTLTADAGLGMIFLRTHDFQVIVDLRYHVTFGSFENAGGNGAHGILLSFGTAR